MKYTIVSFLSIFIITNVNSQEINNNYGVDDRLDYQTLTAFGPWDDRNYDLTLDDLTYLSDEESELKEMVPAFYRVLFRKKYPNSKKTGPGQYPRRFFNDYKMRYGGYLIDGELYTSVTYDQGSRIFKVETSNGVKPGDFLRQQVNALNDEVLLAAGAESAVSISPVNPDIVVAGLNGDFGGQDMLFSSDGGNTWNNAPDLTGSECCDPTIDWKSDGSFVYNATLGGNEVWFYRSDDNGQTWDSLADVTPGDSRRELFGSGNQFDDKEYMHVDKYPGSPHQDNIYLLWDNGGLINFARSTDDGNTFTIQSFNSDPDGIGTDILTDSNGHVYNFWPAYDNSEIRMNKSTNGGVSFSPSTVVSDTFGVFDFPIPSMNTRNVFIYTSVDIDLSEGPYKDRMYVSWTDNTGPDSNNPNNNHAQIRVAYSDDGGDSWTVRVPHETADSNSVDRWHQWLKVDNNGNVQVVFYDTRNSDSRSGVDLYRSYSTDGGESWSSPERLTSVTSPSSSGFQFGDYNGLDIGMDNEGIAIFSDNRAEGGGGADMDVYVAPVPSIDLIFKNGFE